MLIVCVKHKEKEKKQKWLYSCTKYNMVLGCIMHFQVINLFCLAKEPVVHSPIQGALRYFIFFIISFLLLLFFLI